MCRQPGLLGDRDHVRAGDGPTRFAELLGDDLEELASRRVLPLRVVRWKVPTHVAKAGRAKECVDEGVDDGIAVRMPEEPSVVRDEHAPEHEASSWDEAMGIDAVTDPRGHRASSSSSDRSRTRSCGNVILKLRGSPGTTVTGTPIASTSAASSPAVIPCVAACRCALRRTSALNDWGVCAAMIDERSRVAATRPSCTCFTVSTQGTPAVAAPSARAAARTDRKTSGGV